MWTSLMPIIQSTTSVFVIGLPVIGGEAEGRDYENAYTLLKNTRKEKKE